jgi:hypothetical protein
MERPQDAPVRLTITRPQAAKAGLLARYESVMRQREERQAREVSVGKELDRLISALIDFAKSNGLSRRKLLKLAGVSLGSWIRIRDRKVNAIAWLPRLAAAVERLKPSCSPINSVLKPSTLN